MLPLWPASPPCGVVGELSARPVRETGRALGILLLFLAAGSLRAQAPPMGTRIVQCARVTYQAEIYLTSFAGTDEDCVEVVVGKVAGLELRPPRVSVADPGKTILFSHTLRNLGNATDSFTVFGRSPAGWPTRVYLDVNADGVLDPGDPPVSGPIVLAAGSTAALLFAVDVPGPGVLSGTTTPIRLVGQSQFDAAVQDSVIDLVQIRSTDIAIVLEKSVNRASATVGDVLTYTISYRATGSGAGSNLRITDPIPVGATYLRGTLRLNGILLTDGAGDDAGSFETAGNRIVVTLGSIAGGEGGVVTLSALLSGSGQLVAHAPVTNTASATFQTSGGADSVRSNTVQTAVLRSQITLQKTLVGPATARVGDTVQYRLSYGNTSAEVPLKGAVLTDSLPVGLEFASALPAPTVSGRVVQWVLGEIAPAGNGLVLVTLVVSPTVRDTVRLRNSATLTALNADPAVAVAGEVMLIGSAAGSLALTHSAQLLEAGIGETAPFTLVVRNTGSVPLTDLQVHNLLADGARYTAGSATGVDSARARGRELTLYFAGPLAPGGSRLLRYSVAVVSATRPILQNSAYATAREAQEGSGEAVAGLRVRTITPVEDRAVIGRVWVDGNDNGVQDAGESGLPGLDIWTDDGEIATTDAAGRFSYRNIRPGHHGFRLDPASIPVGYRISDAGAGRDMVTRDASGWTTPSVTFRLVPSTGRVISVALDGLSPRFVATPDLNDPSLDQASAAIASGTASVERVVAPVFPADSLPDPKAVPEGGVVTVVLAPPRAGWPGEASFPLPPGWEVLPDAGASAPTLAHDRNGGDVLLWRSGVPRRGMLSFRLRPRVSASMAEPVRVPALRTPEARAKARGRAYLEGPGVEMFTPEDGKILPNDRLYVGIRGEPGAPVALFDGDSVLAQATVRVDSLHDFIAVALTPGPHRLRVRMRNSWSQERWDSIAVHVTGRPAAFSLEKSLLVLVNDGQTIQEVGVRVLDVWGVPVVNHPPVTVGAAGAESVNPDDDASSVGVQVLPDEFGWLHIRLRPGKAVVRGKLRLSAAGVTQEFPLDVLPASQPLLLAAVGRIGIGASPAAFGAMTVRGSLDQRTSLVVSADSRRLDAGRDAFGRAADPLEQAQYPILGDASTQRTSSASRYQLAARVERGFDWLALGDISTAGFGGELRLSGYRRALPGVATRLTTGAVVWEGFGSSTSQTLQQLQVRGAGISGPYPLNGNIRNGTEQVVLEVRAEANAVRVLNREVLERFVDYQIDYEAGTLLLKRPVPATDTEGNPVYIVVLYESDTGGPRSVLWGVRAAVDGNRLLKATVMDSVRVGATWVRESPGAGDHQLLGGDLYLARAGAFTVGGEVSWSQSRDSSGFAASVEGGLTLLHGAARLSATWLTVGREFANPSEVALRSGTEEIRLAGQWKTAAREFKVVHEWQRFGAQGVERQHTTASVVQSIGSRVKLEASLAADRFEGGTSLEASRAGELRINWKPEARWALWTEARHQFASEGSVTRPDYIGAGASFDVTRTVALELRQRLVFLPGDTVHYSVTDFGVRSRIGFGTEAFGSYQIAGVDGARNAALVGLRNHLRLGQAWSLNALFERRTGVDRASVLDPVRALPFLQAEEDYWSLGMGAEFLQPKSPYRLSARGEYRDGTIRSSRLLTVAGDISLNRSLAVLSRQELIRTAQTISGVGTASHRYSTLWGVAFRPTHSNALNLLAKFEAIDASNPNGLNVLKGSNAEGRTMVAAETIWQPFAGTELAARYAMRRSAGSLVDSSGTTQQLRSLADFVGWRAAFRVHRLFELRAEGRLLSERTSATRRYDLAPQLALLPQQMMEIVMGYRFGDLRDPDFAVNGGHGWFVTFGVRLTEGNIASAADFWRQRISGR